MQLFIWSTTNTCANDGIYWLDRIGQNHRFPLVGSLSFAMHLLGLNLSSISKLKNVTLQIYETVIRNMGNNSKITLNDVDKNYVQKFRFLINIQSLK